MDTSDLTPMAHETITQSFDVCEVLRAEIGASASNFRTEDEFLDGVVKFLDVILEDPEDYLDSWDLLDQLDIKTFAEGVRRIQAHAAAVLKTPPVERGKPFFEQ